MAEAAAEAAEPVAAESANAEAADKPKVTQLKLLAEAVAAAPTGSAADRAEQLHDLLAAAQDVGAEEADLVEGRAAYEAALKAVKVEQALQQIKEAEEGSGSAAERLELLTKAIRHGSELNLDGDLLARAELTLQKTRVEVKLEKAIEVRDLETLQADIAEAEKTGCSDAASKPLQKARQVVQELTADRTAAAREGLQGAIESKLMYDLQAATEEAALCGLTDDEDYKAAMELLTHAHRKHKVRQRLDEAMQAYEEETCLAPCLGLCFEQDAAKLQALELAIAQAKALELKEADYLEAEQLLVRKKFELYSDDIASGLTAGERCKLMREALKRADEINVDNDIVEPYMAKEQEIHEHWKKNAVEAIDRALNDDDGSNNETDYDRFVAGATCGLMAKNQQEFHRLGALKAAVADAEAAEVDPAALVKAHLALLEASADVDSRMALLEKRIAELEAERLRYMQTPGFCTRACMLVSDVLSSIPYAAILGFMLSVVGIWMLYRTVDVLQVAVDTLDVSSSDTSTLAGDFVYLLLYVVIADGLALIVAFPATGSLRKALFGNRQQGAAVILEILFGPCVLGVVLVIVAVCCIALAICLCILLPFFTLLGVGSYTCSTDPALVAPIAASLKTLHQFQSPDNKNAIELALGALCDVEHEQILHSGLECLLGLGVLTAAQALLQVNTYSNLQKVMMTTDGA
eukprot:TRINITY_DN80795_c0_g1_i1.p1 TRINITY_DN80795_c0_g1~~TRINITY_DN80795_c0_g1_i1.p1  ORF type:complete len:694 (+),score=231.80 TRINITY_DN80795_c0_g1_i1:109-2190(+)